ncbi:hypothetical protein [uncultured Bradyrhizobium sp.]|jgi:hypothetical protein|uniref:hypothetical protein n=1 Tax=uncultured Bradyrhizobium sp. TaxID=199684 RepID=UPI0026045F10|nr:hypothetical protein [uncultured Bradyrhizobium sp.]
MPKNNSKRDDYERRKQSRLHKLGTNNPRCAVCGNSDWRVIEEHHPDTRKRDRLVVLLCSNHHRLVTYDQKEHPSEPQQADQTLASIGNFLLGLADMLALILERLYEYGEALIARSGDVAHLNGGRK